MNIHFIPGDEVLKFYGEPDREILADDGDVLTLNKSEVKKLIKYLSDLITIQPMEDNTKFIVNMVTDYGYLKFKTFKSSYCIEDFWRNSIIIQQEFDDERNTIILSVPLSKLETIHKALTNHTMFN